MVKAFKGYRGFLVLTLSMVLLVVGLYALSLQKFGNLVARDAGVSNALSRARMMAEAGLAHAIRNIRSPDKSTPANICNKNYALKDIFVSHDFGNNQSYNVSINFDKDSNEEPGPLKLVSIGTADGQTVTLKKSFVDLKYDYYTSQDCGSSVSYLCTRFPTKDKHACNWGCSTDPVDSLWVAGGIFGPSQVAAIDFGFDSVKSQFDNQVVLLARIGFYSVWTDNNSSGNLRFQSVNDSWSESGFSYYWDAYSYESSPAPYWKYRTGLGMRWVDVTALVNKWKTDTYYGVMLRPVSTIAGLSIASREETITSAVRGTRPRIDVRPRLEIFYIPKGSNC